MYTKKFIIDGLDKNKLLFWDSETIGLYGPTRLIQVRQDNISYVYDCFYINIEDLKAFFKPFKIICHNAHYDFSCFNFRGYYPKELHCSLAAARLNWPEFDSHSLDSLCENLKIGDKGKEGASDWSNYNLSEEQINYAENDTLILQKLYEKIDNKIWDSTSYKLDIKALKVCLFMQNKGMITNRAEILKQIRTSEKELNLLKMALPSDLNINSPKQVREFLNLKSSEKAVLQAESNNNPSCNIILKARNAEKTLQFLNIFAKNKFIKCFLNPMGAKTGRFTSKGSDLYEDYVNLQQIPRKLKNCFGLNDGSLYVTADYPTLEIKLAAAIYGDSFMLKHLNSDLHRATASLIFNKPSEQINDIERKIAKVSNFGLLYGAGSKTLKTFFIEQGLFDIDADFIYNKWANIYKDLKALHRQMFDYFKVHNYKMVSTPLGRILKANTPNEALNFPVQGAGSECTKLSLIYLFAEGIIPVNSVHDSIICIAQNKQEADFYAAKIKEAMEKAFQVVIKKYKRQIPLEVDIYIGKDYK